MTPGKQTHDAGVIFENTESLPHGSSPAPREIENLSGQSRRHDPGLNFEVTEARRLAGGITASKKEALSSQIEHRRDGGVAFEVTKTAQPAASPAPPKTELASSQSEPRRDAGVIFKIIENSRSANVPAPGKAQADADAGHRRDGGIVFDDGEVDRKRDSRASAGDEGLLTLLGAVAGFGAAAARFTFGQMQSALFVLTNPSRALQRTRHSFDNLAAAMNEPLDGSPAPPRSGGNPR